MPMLLIEGRFKALNGQPDGDTVKFYPNDPEHWNLLPGVYRVATNGQGGGNNCRRF